MPSTGNMNPSIGRSDRPSFYTLPPELRNIAYDLIVNRPRELSGPFQGHFLLPSPALLRVSRGVRHELKPMYLAALERALLSGHVYLQLSPGVYAGWECVISRAMKRSLKSRPGKGPPIAHASDARIWVRCDAPAGERTRRLYLASFQQDHLGWNASRWRRAYQGFSHLSYALRKLAKTLTTMDLGSEVAAALRRVTDEITREVKIVEEDCVGQREAERWRKWAEKQEVWKWERQQRRTSELESARMIFPRRVCCYCYWYECPRFGRESCRLVRPTSDGVLWDPSR